MSREPHCRRRRPPPLLFRVLERPPPLPKRPPNGGRGLGSPPHEAPRPDDEREDDGGRDEDGGDGEHDPEEGAKPFGVRAAQVAALVAHLGQLWVVHLAGGVLEGEGAQHLLLTLALQRANDRSGKD